MNTLIVVFAVALFVSVAWIAGYILSWATNRHFRGPQTRGERLLERGLPYRPQAERDDFERRWHEERR
jgi:hypothetical protein